MNNLSIVYTPWANLKKTGDMAVGQVGFFKSKEVRVKFYWITIVFVYRIGEASWPSG